MDEPQLHGHSVPMRYRDQPSVEVSRRLPCSPAAAWEVVTDIELPLAHSPELKGVMWTRGTEVAAGNVFQGENENAVRGTWRVDCVVDDVEPGRRWTWDVHGRDGVMATWGFEVDPTDDGGCVARQWARMGPDPSGLSQFIAAHPEKEARIIEGRLQQWRAGMEANLDEVARRTT